jgi:5'-nucleotidase
MGTDQSTGPENSQIQVAPEHSLFELLVVAPHHFEVRVTLNSRITMLHSDPLFESRRVPSRARGRKLQSGMHRRAIAISLLGATAGLTLCSSISGMAEASSKKTETLQILVTNDDGVGAPGINATVKALTALPDTKVTVVAPLTNQSGTGAKVTAGTLTVTNATTASGYPAKAVAGYPADTIIWAMDDHGISQRPNLVVSGINYGQNIGPLAAISGTVGAAQTALARGIPALAVSQGIDNGQSPNFFLGAKYLVAWVQSHRKVLLIATKKTATSTNGSLNVPTCAQGHIRGPVSVAIATSLAGYTISTVNCFSTATKPSTDVQAFVEGFASISSLHPVNPAS